MHRFDAYSSTSYSRGIRWLPSPEVCRMPILYYHFAEFSVLSFDYVTVDDVTVAKDMFVKRMATGNVFQRLKISSTISIFDRHIFNKFVATVFRETNILVIFNVFMKHSALISSQNMMFNL